MDVEVNFSWSGHADNLQRKLSSALHAGHQVDLDLECGEGDDATVAVHRVVLAAASHFFAEIPNSVSRIRITDFSADVVRAVVEYAYAGRVKVSSDDLPHFLAAAKKFRIRGIEKGHGGGQGGGGGGGGVQAEHVQQQQGYVMIEQKEPKKEEEEDIGDLSDFEDDEVEKPKKLTSLKQQDKRRGKKNASSVVTTPPTVTEICDKLGLTDVDLDYADARSLTTFRKFQSTFAQRIRAANPRIQQARLMTLMAAKWRLFQQSNSERRVSKMVEEDDEGDKRKKSKGTGGRGKGKTSVPKGKKNDGGSGTSSKIPKPIIIDDLSSESSDDEEDAVDTAGPSSAAATEKRKRRNTGWMTKFSCPTCGTSCPTGDADHFREHLSVIHYNDILKNEFSELNPRSKRCSICQMGFTNSDTLVRHLGSHHQLVDQHLSAKEMEAMANLSESSSSENTKKIRWTEDKNDSTGRAKGIILDPANVTPEKSKENGGNGSVTKKLPKSKKKLARKKRRSSEEDEETGGDDDVDTPLARKTLTMHQCPTCPKSFRVNSSSFRVHLSLEHYSEQLRKGHVNPNDGKKCGFCDHVFKSPNGLLQHLGSHHNLVDGHLDEEERKVLDQLAGKKKK